MEICCFAGLRRRVDAVRLCSPSESHAVACFRLLLFKETQWLAGRHKQDLQQETIKGTRTGEKCQPTNAGQQHHKCRKAQRQLQTSLT